MRTIGITGGVGAGKSMILRFLEDEYGAYAVRADELAAELMQPGHDCYERLVAEFSDQGDVLYSDDGSFDKAALSRCIFSDGAKRARLNAVVHPAVKEWIISDIEAKRADGVPFYILEAALLIEEHYDSIVDELWYIYASRETRSKRLKERRGYSDERIDEIMAAQLSEEDFRAHCLYVINNDTAPEGAFGQIRMILSQQETGR